MDQRTTLTDQILDLYNQFFHALLTSQRDAWLTVELTVAQLKTLLVIVERGKVTGSQLARTLGVGPPNITRIVTRLYDEGLIERHDDPEDRRITSIVATTEGQRVVECLYSCRREYLSALLTNVYDEQLDDVRRGLALLAEAASVHRDNNETVTASGGELEEDYGPSIRVVTPGGGN